MSKVVTLKVASYTLNPQQVENLAEDYFGKVLTLTAEDAIKPTMEIEFNDVALTENEKILDGKAEALAAGFMSAMDSFQRPKRKARE